MLCFLPPAPAIRPEPRPERDTPQAARAAQAVILIFVVLNILFVMTGMLPLLMAHDRHGRVGAATAQPVACLPWSDASMAACTAAQRVGGRSDRD